MSELTVFLAPDVGAAGVLDVLCDLSGAGMVRPFHWVRGSDVRAAVGYRAVEVTDGRRVSTALQETIVQRRVARVRLCVLVPLMSAPEPVSSQVEQELVGLLSSNVGGVPVTRMRCLLSRGGDLVPDSDDIAREGWHNLLVAPESSLGPTAGRWVLPTDTPPATVDALLAPAIAGIVGLWDGVDGCALDELAIPTGKAARVARTFYRRVEAGEVENELRGRVLTTRPQLPLPRQTNGPATVYLGDPGAACETMAQALWRAHRVGRGPDPAAQATAPRVGTGTVLPRLPMFLLAAARNNPQRWYGPLSKAVRYVVPHQQGAFAALPQSHVWLLRGVRPDGLPLSWDEVGGIADEVEASLPPLQDGPLAQEVGPDLTRLWQDFTGGALTLADAGDRGGPEMPPAQAGPARGVVERVESCAPGPESDFRVGVPNVAARTGIETVQAGDLLGADVLRRRLASLQSTMNVAEARSVAEVYGALGEWEAGQAATYPYQAARPIAHRLHEVGEELRGLFADLTAAARPPELTLDERDRQLRLGQVLLGICATGTLALLVTILTMVLSVGFATGALITGGVALLVAVGIPAACYRIGLRRTFRELSRYRQLTARVEADQPRLRRALREYRRLRDTYTDYLRWSRAVAVVLADPFGRSTDAAACGPTALRGLAPPVQVGHAATDPDALPRAAATLRGSLFVTGWLSGPWEANLDSALRSLIRTPPPGVRPEQMFSSRAYPGGDQPLRAWSEQLGTDGPDRAVGDQFWADVLSNLGRHGVRDTLRLRIRDNDGQSLKDFLAGVDGVDFADHRFDEAHFTPGARTQDRARVAGSVTFSVQRGLSETHVRVQLSDAVPQWELDLLPDEPPDDEPLVTGNDPDF